MARMVTVKKFGRIAGGVGRAKEQRIPESMLVEPNRELRRQFPGETLGFVVKQMERGPNKGKRHVMRKFKAPDGSVHTAPVGGNPESAARLAKRFRRQ